MEYPVTIEFYLPGTQPPVYIGTDLSQPQWRPVEMDSTQDEDGEYRFSMTFEAKEGEYQYKLRLGPGDWWICDDSVPKITDEAGNENNAVIVKSEGAGAAHDDAARQDSHQEDSAHLAPLMPHEILSSEKSQMLSPERAASALQHDEHDHDNLHEPETHSPLFSHETLLVPPVTGSNPEDEDDGDVEPESSPLLRHESAALSLEQDHCPLFRHESIAIDNKQYHDEARRYSSPRTSSRKHSSASIPEEADPNDPTLERFPTDHKGILEHIDRTRRSLQEDETSEDVGSPQRQTPPGSVLGSTPSSLPSVREDDGEEAQEEATMQPEELDPNADVPQVMISEPQDRPMAPMTPPMTPKEERSQNDDDESAVDTPMSVSEHVHHIKKKAHHKAKQAAESSLPALAVGLAVALAAASVLLSMWYIKAKSDNIVL